MNDCNCIDCQYGKPDMVPSNKKSLELGTVFRSDGIEFEKLSRIVDDLQKFAEEHDIMCSGDGQYTLSPYEMLDDACMDGKVYGWVFGFGYICGKSPSIFAAPNYPFALGPDAYGADHWSDVDDWF